MSPSSTFSAVDARQLAEELGLSAIEFRRVQQQLGRLPTRPELSIFAGMWSEHCSYKSTKHLLATLPRSSARVLAGPGAHAGVVEVGDGWAVAFKMESHNHPSAVEPYQGAATGVGGILRDIIAQGARPCAVMDALCFGSPDSRRMQHLENGIVEGIAGYGNAFGVPNVGGRTVYDERYGGNPLVNVLAAGLLRPSEMRSGNARGAGYRVVYVGASTGRDGILGAAFASEELADDTMGDRAHVQVGDPFTGKKLMEACLSFGAARGLVSCQDMGACGITCAATEMAAEGGVGMDVDLDRVPLREMDMSADEILLSESQERFLFVVEAEAANRARDHFRDHGVEAEIIGITTNTGRVRFRHRGEWVADVSAREVADGAPPANWPVGDLAPPPPPYPSFAPVPDVGDVLLRLLARPGIADCSRIFERYDQTVGNRTVRSPGTAEAAVLRVPDSCCGFALTIATRGDLCAVDPYRGAQAVLAKAYRSLAGVGAMPVAITDGLNLGSPQVESENRKLVEVVRGLRDGLLALELPVTGGNVSLYNESSKGPIPPSPMVGALGLIDDVRRVPYSAAHPEQVVLLLGELQEMPVTSVFGASRTGMLSGGEIRVDLAAEVRLARLLVDLVRLGLVSGVKDGGLGGLGVALAKLCINGQCGIRVTVPPEITRPDWWLFGEYPATAWATTTAENAPVVLQTAEKLGVPGRAIGTSGGSRLALDGVLACPIVDLTRAFRGALP